MDDKQLDLTADADDAELYGADEDETDPLWTGALEDEAKEDRESGPGDSL
jgi:hypothetical protein